MGIFKLFKGEDKKPKSQPQAKKAAPTVFPYGNKIIETYHFVNSPGFRGFKLVPLAAHGFEPALKNIDALKIPNPNYDGTRNTPQYIFELKNVDVNVCRVQWGNSEDKMCLMVLLGELHIGTHFCYSDDPYHYYQAFVDGNVTDVHVRFEEERIFGKDTEEIRYTPKMFVKFTEK